MVYEDGDKINHQKPTTSMTKKKEISWNSDSYFNNVYLEGGKSRCVVLERKASIGPCKSKTRFSAASGLIICVPKKSTNNLREICDAQGINISISAKKFTERKIPRTISEGLPLKIKSDCFPEKRAVKVDLDIPYLKIFSIVKGTFEIVRHKIYNAFMN